jgi:hypothetical protein
LLKWKHLVVSDKGPGGYGKEPSRPTRLMDVSAIGRAFLWQLNVPAVTQGLSSTLSQLICLLAAH